MALTSPRRPWKDLQDEVEFDDATPLADPYDGTSYRLPNTTVPLAYDISLSTNIHRGDFDFYGRVIIRFEVLETTNEVVVQYRYINIQDISILNSNNQLIESSVPFTLNETVEFLIIRPNQQLIKGEQYSVIILYNGVIRDDGLGWYRASYVNPEGETVWLSTTQFQATEARHAFPWYFFLYLKISPIIFNSNSYDEPGRRSLFTVSIRHDASYTALSNTPVASRISVPGTNYVVTTFEQTLSMQTYLVAFTVSDFVFIEDASAVPPQRIYAKQESIENGDGNMALDASLKLMEGYEKYLKIPYSFAKMDQFACPDFLFGGMENWGLAIYFESFLLFDENIDRTRDHENIVTIISHEFAVS